MRVFMQYPKVGYARCDNTFLCTLRYLTRFAFLVTAIFQRKSESQSATAEQKKVQRGMLGGFLRTALQGPSAIAECKCCNWL